MQATQAYVGERDRVLGVHSYDGARSHLCACGHHGIKIRKDRVIESDQIVRNRIRTNSEVGDGVLPEAGQEDEGVVTPSSSERVVSQPSP